jgi:2-iminobutanoate/2-iminopropanoate deaminase
MEVTMSVDARKVKVDPDPFEQFHISQGFVVGNLVFLSGQVAIDENGVVIEGDFDTQAEWTFRNLQRALDAAGSGLDRIIRVTIYLTDMKSQRPKVMALRKKWFTPPYPADTLVGVRELGHPSRMIEIEAIALVGGRLID